MPINFLSQAKMKMPNLLQNTGGEALPPYLQSRAFLNTNTNKSKPVVTPKPMVTPSEVKPQVPLAGSSVPGAPSLPAGQQPPMVTPHAGQQANVAPPKPAAPTPIPEQPMAPPEVVKGTLPQGSVPLPDKYKGDGFLQRTLRKAWINGHKAKFEAMGFTWDETFQAFVPGNKSSGDPWSNPQKTYDYLKGELEASKKTAVSNAVADASARGVYYGTPLTTSQGDIETQFAKGQGALDAAMWEKSSQLQMQKLALAAQLIGQYQQSGFDPSVLAMLGQLFGNAGSAKPAGA